MIMRLRKLELNAFKSFAHRVEFSFDQRISAIVGPNGSGKSNVVEAIRFVLGEQSIKSMRGKSGSDLIFKGSHTLSKSSRASVQIFFENKDRIFKLNNTANGNLSLDFDEIRIRREVYRDGGNRYFINDTEVRMKDIHDLISSIHIGSSGHHIISQGEADRYLNANAKERRQLIEEALGLKQFQIKLRDAEKKLEKARRNLKELEIIRREIQPQLKFLEKQVERIKETERLRQELFEKFSFYYFLEKDRLEKKEKNLIENLSKIRKEIQEKEQKKKNLEIQEEDPYQDELYEKRNFVQSWEVKIQESERELGKIEGALSVLSQKEKREEKQFFFPHSLVSIFFKKIIQSIKDFLDKGEEKNILPYLEKEFSYFLQKPFQNEKLSELDYQKKIKELQRKKAIYLNAKEEAKKYRDTLLKEIETLETKREKFRKSFLSAKEKFYRLQSELESLIKQSYSFEKEIDLIRLKKESLEHDLEEILRISAKKTLEKNYENVNRVAFLERREIVRKEIERLKIRIEELGFSSGENELINEYTLLRERDTQILSEIEDLERSIISLYEIISSLKGTIEKQFSLGIKKVNEEFAKLFRLMFGGGEARLERVKIQRRGEEEDSRENEEGVEIYVKIPRKKVSDLEMLSGGERSLTSIALLFALSQVNPPPFLVLDETDAALDEENSRRYGDLIEMLSEKSQLILVTHNRETMSRAQILFGVSLGKDASSHVFSLKLEDAYRYAK